MSAVEFTGAKGHAEVRDPTAAERAVGRRAAEARATIPDLELAIDVEVSAALQRCESAGHSLDALLVGACARALRSVPQANGGYRDGRFERYSRVNIGVVLASEEAYLIPTVFDADRKSASELTEELARLRAAATAGELASPAFSGATFTLWNAGALGVDRAGMVINPGHAAALSAGAVRDAPVVREGQLGAGKLLTLTLACDHRVLYGAAAAVFLRAVGTTLT
jgi:pyruvate dehydrogenase E2 component (dihydrolipoamide acetyltransferase)